MWVRGIKQLILAHHFAWGATNAARLREQDRLSEGRDDAQMFLLFIVSRGTALLHWTPLRDIGFHGV